MSGRGRGPRTWSSRGRRARRTRAAGSARNRGRWGGLRGRSCGGSLDRERSDNSTGRLHRSFGLLQCEGKGAFLSDLNPRRDLTGRARPADLRGECPPAPACGGRLPLYFAPKAYRSRRASDRRHVGGGLERARCDNSTGRLLRGFGHLQYEGKVAFLSDLNPRRDLTGPARPADLRGECPPAPACGGRPPLYFAPKAYRSRRASDRRHAGKAGQPVFRLWAAVQDSTLVRMSLGAQSGRSRRPRADAGGHLPPMAFAPAPTIFKKKRLSVGPQGPWSLRLPGRRLPVNKNPP